MDKDALIIKLGDELLRMSRQLSLVAERRMLTANDRLIGCAGCGRPLICDGPIGYCHECPRPEGRMSECKFPEMAGMRGWRCTRGAGHEGPCAAVQDPLPMQRGIPAVVEIVPPKTVHEAVAVLLRAAGEDPERDGLKETPERFRRAWEEMLSGYKEDVPGYFKLFEGEDYDEMILVRDIPFTSICEHHLMPFQGKVHVGYVPHKKIIGLSKIARVVLAYAKRLQVQERLTSQITQAFMDHVPECLGAACVVEASHTCMACRGVRVPNTTMVTSSLKGAFRDKPEARDEFLKLIR